MTSSTTTNTAKQNFDLSESAFNELAIRLRDGDETLFERVFTHHFEGCRGYLHYECNATWEDAYDTTVDTIIRFRKLILEDKIHYGNLRYLFTKMAKDAYVRGKTIDKRIPKADLDGETPVQIADIDAFDQRLDPDIVELLDRSFVQLGGECQQVLKGYYYDGLQYKEMADQTGDSSASLRKRKERCMEKLKSLFFDIYNQ
ncbi:MAG: hypothetical protein RL757_550 [Bacteroidota bacterium]|jgi:RNA polymerase sigma factor (sigma-70 family)